VPGSFLISAADACGGGPEHRDGTGLAEERAGRVLLKHIVAYQSFMRIKILPSARGSGGPQENTQVFQFFQFSLLSYWQ